MTEQLEKTVPVLIGDHTRLMTSDDDYVTALGAEFEPESVELFNTLIKPSDKVLDIGANIGCTALLFSGLAKHVIAFEPAPSTFRFLKMNVEAAGAGNVTLVNAGLGRSASEMTIAFSAANRSGGFVSKESHSGHKVEAIRIFAGDEYLQNQHHDAINFIKVDVEGFEQEVITGLAQTIAKHRPIVSLELNHWCLNAFQRISIPDFLDFLRSVFPVLYAVDASGVKDLHKTDESFEVMYHHIVHFKYMAIVGAFSAGQLEDFTKHYITHRPPLPLAPPPSLDPTVSLMAELRRVHEHVEELNAALKAAQEYAHGLQNAKRELQSANESGGHAQALLQQEITAMRTSTTLLQQEIAALRNSKSWKFTAPMRVVRRWFV